MLILIFAAIIFAFLFIGAVVFAVSTLLPFARQHALSAALGCAVWGPCVVALLSLAGLGLVAEVFARQQSHLQQFERLPSVLGPAYAIIGLLGTIAVASVAAWVHQRLIHRLTFALFRLYASLVCVGIGSVFGWALGFWLSANAHGNLILWLCAMLAVCTAFGYGGFRYAGQLRGEPPQHFTWITPEEFDGNS